MKLTFINTSKFVIRAFQVVISSVAVVGVFVLIFVQDTHTNLTFGPLSLNSSDPVPSVAIKSINAEIDDPDLVIDKARMIVPMSGWQIKTGFALVFVGLSALAVYVLNQLMLMIKTLENGNPFVRGNVWRIYILATAVYLIPVLTIIYKWVTYQWVSSNFELTGLSMQWNTPEVGVWVLCGTLLITIGKIFEQGIKLREESQLTI